MMIVTRSAIFASLVCACMCLRQMKQTAAQEEAEARAAAALDYKADAANARQREAAVSCHIVVDLRKILIMSCWL